MERGQGKAITSLVWKVLIIPAGSKGHQSSDSRLKIHPWVVFGETGPKPFSSSSAL